MTRKEEVSTTNWKETKRIGLIHLHNYYLIILA